MNQTLCFVPGEAMCILRSEHFCLEPMRERFNMCVVNVQIKLHDHDYCVEAWHGEKPLAKECVPLAEVAQGFADLKIDDEPLSLAKVLQTYAESTNTLKYSREIGAFLSRVLTHRVLETLLRLQDTFDTEGVSVLLKILPPELRQLPWEILSFKGRPLFRRSKHPVCLCSPEENSSVIPCEWPLRMLIMVGNSSGAIKCPEEVWEIRRAIGRFALRVDITVVYPKAAAEAAQSLVSLRPHIFHFVGHGDEAGDGALDLLSEGGGVRWTRDDIFTTLDSMQPVDRPRMVVLNACNTAGLDGVDGGDSVSEIFVRTGSSIVIGTRQDFGAEAALLFAASFYSELAKNGLHHADRAYCHAINQVASENNFSLDWSTPRIYLQKNWQSVFLSSEKLCCGAEEDLNHSDLRQLRTFLDRDTERFKLYHDSAGWLKNPVPPIQLISGNPDSGKSWLLRSLVYAAKLQGRRAIYVDMRGVKGELEYVLDYLRTGDVSKGYLSQPICTDELGKPSPFAKFDRLRIEPGPSATNEDPKKPLLDSFREALASIGQDRLPILIALDHIEKLDVNACWKYIRDGVIKPLTDSKTNSKVAFAIAVNKFNSEDLGIEKLPAGPPIELKSPLTEGHDELLATLFQREVQDEPDYKKIFEEFLRTIERVDAKRKSAFELRVLHEKSRAARLLLGIS